MSRWLLLPLLAGCIDPSTYAESPVITSNVVDWRDEVVYQLLVDRFANGDINNDYNAAKNDEVLSRYLGGDYQGVIERADYLSELGVTALWVSPIVANVEEDAGVASYHGYWTQDFKGVNPHFGDLAKFREMVQILHERDIKVILDIVVNHIGQLFYYDINRNGQPDTTVYGSGSQFGEDPFWEDPLEVVTEWDPRFDERGVQGWTSLGESGPAPLGWVYMPEINRLPPEPAGFHNDEWYNRRGRVTDWDVTEQVVKGDFPGGLKDLDTTHPDVVAALIDVFQYWITETDIDGYRIDTVKHVEHGFWQQFNPAIRDHAASLGKDNFLQFGEVFDGDDELIGSYSFDNELDSLFYFSQKWQVFDDVFKRGGPTKNVETLFALRSVNYGDQAWDNGIGVAPQQSLINFIDNHDIPRFLFDNSDERALSAALTFLLTEDGVPCIYYGTEQGFSGGNDPANREPLWWSGFATDGALFQHTANLIRVRRTYLALRRGDFSLRWTSERTADEEDAGMLAFERSIDDDRVLVVIHTKDGTGSTSFDGASMATGFQAGTELAVIYPLDDDRTFTVDSGGNLKVELGAYESLVLVPASDVLPLVD
jgi:alpha-amylase